MPLLNTTLQRQSLSKDTEEGREFQVHCLWLCMRQASWECSTYAITSLTQMSNWCGFMYYYTTLPCVMDLHHNCECICHKPQQIWFASGYYDTCNQNTGKFLAKLYSILLIKGYSNVTVLIPLRTAISSWWRGLHASVILRAVLSGATAPGRVAQGKEVSGEEPDWECFKDPDRSASLTYCKTTLPG